MHLILLTAAGEDIEETLGQLGEKNIEYLHLPLEHYVPVEDTSFAGILDRLDQFEQVAYGSLRNARFLLEAVRKRGLMEQLRGRVNVTVDRRTASWLDSRNIPAICPDPDTVGPPDRNSLRAIDLMEFLLRLRRTGPTLYPCGMETAEELPGLLRELDLPVEELVLFETEGPGEERLEAFRAELNGRRPDAVVFHSRRAVVRTLAAFPKLDLEQATVVAADTGITQKLEEEGIVTDLEASGSWESVVEMLEGANP